MYLFFDLPGLSKKSTNFLGSAPSLCKNLTTQCQTKMFKELLGESCADNIQFQPRSARQVQHPKD